MKYLLLIYHAKNALDGYTQTEMESLYQHHIALQEKARANGAFLATSRLRTVSYYQRCRVVVAVSSSAELISTNDS